PEVAGMNGRPGEADPDGTEGGLIPLSGDRLTGWWALVRAASGEDDQAERKHRGPERTRGDPVVHCVESQMSSTEYNGGSESRWENSVTPSGRCCLRLCLKSVTSSTRSGTGGGAAFRFRRTRNRNSRLPGRTLSASRLRESASRI